MELRRDESSEYGRYTNPAWTRGAPGTFAVIIGVSSYPYLRDGTGRRASDTYDLGQLYVSALTAHDCFRWIGSDYRSDAPLASCWFLASPAAGEIGERPDLKTAGVAATFENCRGAIREWFAVMKDLEPESAAGSRSLFFFSGHGIERNQNQQLLLPSDFVAPPDEAVDDVIVTANLVNGLSALEVSQHLLLVDACRDDATRLRDVDIRGSTILNQVKSSAANPDFVAPILHAAGPGQLAYQFKTADKRSLFGTALLEGLTGSGGVELDCTPEACTVWVYSLQKMMKARVAALSRSKLPRPQRVLLGGAVDDFDVTSLGPPAEFGLDEPSPLPAEAAPTGVAPSGADSQDEHDAPGDESSMEAWAPLVRAFSDIGRISSLAGRDERSLGESSMDVIGVRPTEAGRFVLDLAWHGPPEDLWFSFPDPAGGMWGAALPADGTGSPEYQLQVNLGASPTGGLSLESLAAAVTPLHGQPELELAMQAWSAYETEGVSAVIALIRNGIFSEVAAVAAESPLAALIVLNLEILSGRARPFAATLDLASMPDGTEDDSDFLVLAAEARTVQRSTELWSAVLERVGELGLPRLMPTLVRLDSQIQTLKIDLVPEELPVALRHLESRVNEALRYADTEALFFIAHGTESVGPFLIAPEHELA